VANLIFRSAERRAARVTDHFVVVCNAMKQQYLKAGIGSPDQYTRVFSGFPLEPFLAAKNDLALRARLGLAPSDIVVGKIARLFRLKGHEDLFTAAPEIVRHTPEVKFLLLGGGEWCDRFKSLARTQGLEKHFVFAGLVPPQEIARYVGIMDALVHLSRREGLARALPQALAAGKPVIAYDCDGAGEVCINGETGFLVPPGDLTALVRAVTTLAGDSALRRQLGERGRELVAERFSVENMVASLRQLYLRLVREPSHSPAPTA
jgi:glycosyltransferase involved in cell wall biosynthesis